MGKKMKRFAAVILTAVLICTGIVIYGKTRGEESATVFVPSFPRSSDSRYGEGDWGNDDLDLMHGYSNVGYGFFTVQAIGSWSGHAAYCIEPGTPICTGDGLSSREMGYIENLPDVEWLSKKRQKELIGLILHYGYEGKVDMGTWLTDNPQGKNELSHYMATQLLIWETVVGERDENFNLIPAENYGKDPVRNYTKPDSPIYESAFEHYGRMEGEVKRALLLPEFMESGETVNLSYNSENRMYEAYLEDGNGVLEHFELTEPEGLSFEKDGNTLKVSSPEHFEEKTSEGLRGNLETSSYIVWTDGYLGPEHKGKQDIVEYMETEGFVNRGNLKFTAKRATGGILLRKVDSEYRDVAIDGAEFTVFTEDGEEVCKMEETGDPGIYRADDLLFGTYLVKETKAPEGYVPDDTVYKAVLEEDGDPLVIIGDEDGNFPNSPEKGKMRIEKTDTDGETPLSGAEFEYYIDKNGDGIIGEDAEPLGVFAELSESPGTYETEELRKGTYLVREKKAPEGFHKDEKVYKVDIKENGETVTVENSEGTGKFFNIPRTGSLKITKTSEDGMLKGFRFKLISPEGEEQILETDDNGEIKVKGLRPGTYVVREEEGKGTSRYILPEPQKAEIKADEETEVKFRNRLKPEDPVKTADPGTIAWYGLLGASVARMALWLTVDRRKL